MREIEREGIEGERKREIEERARDFLLLIALEETNQLSVVTFGRVLCHSTRNNMYAYADLLRVKKQL